MSRPRPVVAIDGPAAAGKSTAGRSLAERLGYLYIDTGALYRAIGLKARRLGVDQGNGAALERMLDSTVLCFARTPEGMRILLDGEDVTETIRGEEGGAAASLVGAHPEVRRTLLGIQRELGREGGIVMDGRDIGTVVFPDAEVKFFVTASLEERACRRRLEMASLGIEASEEDVREEVRRRDEQDAGRLHSPLVRAGDALLVDTTGRGPDEVLAILLNRVRQASFR